MRSQAPQPNPTAEYLCCCELYGWKPTITAAEIYRRQTESGLREKWSRRSSDRHDPELSSKNKEAEGCAKRMESNIKLPL